MRYHFVRITQIEKRKRKTKAFFKHNSEPVWDGICSRERSERMCFCFHPSTLLIVQRSSWHLVSEFICSQCRNVGNFSLFHNETCLIEKTLNLNLSIALHETFVLFINFCFPFEKSKYHMYGFSCPWNKSPQVWIFRNENNEYLLETQHCQFYWSFLSLCLNYSRFLSLFALTAIWVLIRWGEKYLIDFLNSSRSWWR